MESAPPRAEVTVYSPLLSPFRQPLQGTMVSIGRASDCSIPIKDRYLSRKHAEIIVVSGKWMLKDLGSANGTYLNGARVEHDELLLDPALHEVTSAYVGGYNGDCDVSYAAAAVSEEAVAGKVWRRITGAGDRLIVHLLNLVGQPDTLWDAARSPFGDPGAGELRVRRLRERVPRIRVADPDGEGRLVDLPVRIEGETVVAALPALNAWQLVLIEFAPDAGGAA